MGHIIWLTFLRAPNYNKINILPRTFDNNIHPADCCLSKFPEFIYITGKLRLVIKEICIHRYIFAFSSLQRSGFVLIWSTTETYFKVDARIVIYLEILETYQPKLILKKLFSSKYPTYPKSFDIPCVQIGFLLMLFGNVAEFDCESWTRIAVLPCEEILVSTSRASMCAGKSQTL